MRIEICNGQYITQTAIETMYRRILYPISEARNFAVWFFGFALLDFRLVDGGLARCLIRSAVITPSYNEPSASTVSLAIKRIIRNCIHIMTSSKPILNLFVRTDLCVR